MNENISKLLNASRIQDHWSVDEHRYLTDFVDQEKFADLIIQECCNQVALDEAEYIMKHFGDKNE